MKNPKIVVTDNRDSWFTKELMRRVAEEFDRQSKE